MSDNPFSIRRQELETVLWNPTNEDFNDMQYAGISIALKSGEKWACHTKCGAHLLNAYGQRGLTSLTYGCDEERVGLAAVQRNHDFKTKMVVDFNQTNENRKHMNLGYHPPSDKIKQYAIELGLKLFEPYTVRDEERGAIQQLASQNDTLMKIIERQEKEMAEIKELMKSYPRAVDTPKTELRVKKNGKWVKDETVGPTEGAV